MLRTVVNQIMLKTNGQKIGQYISCQAELFSLFVTIYSLQVLLVKYSSFLSKFDGAMLAVMDGKKLDMI